MTAGSLSSNIVCFKEVEVREKFDKNASIFFYASYAEYYKNFNIYIFTAQVEGKEK